MAQFTRIEVAQTMKESGMVPLFFHQDAAVAKKVLKACYDGGARLMEFTNRGDFALEVFTEASAYMLNGANFVVTPVLREDIAVVCNRRKVLWSPGCGSLTEIAKAEELGCEIVKLFPGSTYGPGFVKGVLAPQPWTNIMPTGGVSPTEENLKGWFDAGVTCVGMGSKLMAKHADGSFDYAKIEAQTRNALKIISSLR